jgi:ABC-2 type transport system permease protein
MRKVLVIAAREYKAAVRTKAFVIGLLVMPLMMGGSIIVQRLFKDVRDTKEKTFVVIDRTAPTANGSSYFAAIERAVAQYNAGSKDPATGKLIRSEFKLERVSPSGEDAKSIEDQRLALSEQVRQGKLFGFLEISGLTVVPQSAFLGAGSGLQMGLPQLWPGLRLSVRYASNRVTFGDFAQLVEKAVDGAAQERRADYFGLSPDVQLEVTKPVPVESKGLSSRKADGAYVDASEEDRIASFLVPFALIMLMFMVVMMGSTPLMQGVVEEKMQRIAEVLLGSVRPFELMMGKLLGMTAVSLTITAVYLGGGYWGALEYDYAKYLPGNLVAWFLLFQVLSALMYGSLFIAIGAACTDAKETQNLVLPVMLLACLPLFMLANVLQEPNSKAATGLSFFPFSTPMLMVARMAVPPGIDGWQPLVGALVVVVTTVACVYAAGRIFRVGLLMQGKGARLGDLVRWVFRG